MIREQDLCSVCFNVLSEPVCKNCYLNEINIWLMDLKINPPLRNIIINKVKKELEENPLNEKTCIICNKENLSICSSCVFLKVTEILNDLNLP